MLPLAILASSVVGAAVGITLIVLRRHDRDTPIPFGPYLAGAGLVVLFWGTALTRDVLGLLAP
jgi:leader peptidase (prepilin peptidase)/N-methyltransferase